MTIAGTGTLRRDGFAALHRNLSAGAVGLVNTFLLRFDAGDTLYINANTTYGKVSVGVADEAGKPLPGLGLAQCDGLSGTDSTEAVVSWAGKAAPLGLLVGRPFQLTFELHGGAQLYSFWVAEKRCGAASQGFVAAGSADLPGPRDNRCTVDIPADDTLPR
jgi:hypothetical protein